MIALSTTSEKSIHGYRLMKDIENVNNMRVRLSEIYQRFDR